MSDPRLKNMIRLLNNLKAPGLTSIEDLKLDANSFKSVLNENMVLITKALQNQVQAETKMSSDGSPWVTEVAKRGHPRLREPCHCSCLPIAKFSQARAHSFGDRCTMTPLYYLLALSTQDLKICSKSYRDFFPPKRRHGSLC